MHSEVLSGEVLELLEKLAPLVKRDIQNFARKCAEEIAEQLLDEEDLDEICPDIDTIIDLSHVSDWIEEEAERNTEQTDAWIAAMFIPLLNLAQVDPQLLRAILTGRDFSIEEAVRVYARELWSELIRKELKKVLEERCKTEYSSTRTKTAEAI